MELIKSILRLQLSEAHRPWLDLRNIIRTVGEEPKAEIQGQPLVINRSAKKERIKLQMRGLILEQETVESLDHSSSRALQVLFQIHQAVPLPSLAQVRYDVMAIDPYPLPFHELVLCLKRLFLQPCALLDAADDIGIVYDEHEGDIAKSVQIGPMEARQLQSTYLAFPKKGLSPQFVFAGLGYSYSGEMEPGEARMKEFFRAANSWQTEQFSRIFDLVRQAGGG